MKTIAEIEENPLEFVRWSKATFAEEHGGDLDRMNAAIRAREAESRAVGRRFVDFSKPVTYEAAAPESSVLREDPPEATGR